MDSRIHRANLRGGTLCGAPGPVRISASGAPSSVTCPECRELSRPRTREEMLADLADRSIDRNAAIRRIRAALQARTGRAWSVTGGRGTAWGWITITAPPARRVCSRGPSGGSCGPSCQHERYYLAADDASMLALALGLTGPAHHQGISVPASSDYYLEHVDRAEGRPPRAIGRPYWD